MSKRATITPEHLEEARKLLALYTECKTNGHLKKVSQAAMGADYGIGSQALVWQFLHGRTALTLDAAVGFANALRCEVADFSERLAEKQRQLARKAPEAEKSPAADVVLFLRRTVSALAKEWGVDPRDLTDPSDDALVRMERDIEKAMGRNQPPRLSDRRQR